MEIDLTIKNYRCFADSHPARLRLRPGTTSIVGRNNAGKSSLLKFFYELRHLFQLVAGDRNAFTAVLGAQARAFDLPAQVPDPNGLCCDLNGRDISIDLSFSGDSGWVAERIP